MIDFIQTYFHCTIQEGSEIFFRLKNQCGSRDGKKEQAWLKKEEGWQSLLC